MLIYSNSSLYENQQRITSAKNVLKDVWIHHLQNWLTAYFVGLEMKFHKQTTTVDNKVYHSLKKGWESK